MSNAKLPFEYYGEKSAQGLTSFSGLPLYIELANISGLNTAINEALKLKQRGWTDQQILMTLILLNISGGDCVEDVNRLEADEGLSGLILKIETSGMKRKERRAYERRWRKTKRRAFPSAASIHRYLEKFHNASEEKLRKKGVAYIPKKNDSLELLVKINSTLINFAQSKNPSSVATLDQDATLAKTHKNTALYCYEKHKAYQPFNTYWVEQEMILHSEFRDGNVPAGYEQLRILQETLELLPEGVEKVYVRSDSAGYQVDFLRYCAEGKNQRFGVIEFAVATKVTKSFKLAVAQIEDKEWQAIYKTDGEKRVKTEQEWAEVCFVPSWLATSKNSLNYRFIAIRERMSVQAELDGIEPVQQELPFQTIQTNNKQYKLFGMVTNRKLSGNELINWHRKRCGDSEKIHSVEKGDLAGGQFPSNKFGANAAWWQIMILAFNLNQLMKVFALPKPLKNKRLKKLRFEIICVSGHVVSHARKLLIKLGGGLQTVSLIRQIRENIHNLTHAPPLITV